MKFVELQDALDEAMGQVLASVGFRRAIAGTWNRRRNDELNVIQLQARSEGGSFCVNLGIHFIFLPKAGSESPIDCDRIEVVDCDVKLRLVEHVGSKDQWWPIAPSSVGTVASLVCSRGLPIFESYRLDGPIAGMTGKDIERGQAGILESMTKVRACLLLARMHERLGNRQACLETAKIGVSLAGMAVGPKAALADIIRRLDAR